MEPSPAPKPADPSSSAVPTPRGEPVSRPDGQAQAVGASGDNSPPLAPLVPSQPPAGVIAQVRSASRWPMRLAIAVGVLSLLCVAGIGLAYHFYDKSTTPNRTDPDVTLTSFLQAYLVDRDDEQAAQFECRSTNSLADIRRFRTSVVHKEGQLGTAIGISYQEHGASSQGPTVTIDTTLTESATVDGVVQTVPTAWRFVLMESNGWRVCGATEIS